VIVDLVGDSSDEVLQGEPLLPLDNQTLRLLEVTGAIANALLELGIQSPQLSLVSVALGDPLAEMRAQQIEGEGNLVDLIAASLPWPSGVALDSPAQVATGHAHGLLAKIRQAAGDVHPETDAPDRSADPQSHQSEGENECKDGMRSHRTVKAPCAEKDGDPRGKGGHCSGESRCADDSASERAGV
jgi:hypothetical protein